MKDFLFLAIALTTSPAAFGESPLLPADSTAGLYSLADASKAYVGDLWVKQVSGDEVSIEFSTVHVRDSHTCDGVARVKLNGGVGLFGDEADAKKFTIKFDFKGSATISLTRDGSPETSFCGAHGSILGTYKTDGKVRIDGTIAKNLIIALTNSAYAITQTKGSSVAAVRASKLSCNATYNTALDPENPKAMLEETSCVTQTARGRSYPLANSIALMDALSAAGMGDCGMGHCSAQSSLVNCEIHTTEKLDSDSRYRCDLAP